jgi:hypothetical protein
MFVMAVPRVTSADLKRRIDARRAPHAGYAHPELAFEPDTLARRATTRARSRFAVGYPGAVSIPFSGTSPE